MSQTDATLDFVTFAADNYLGWLAYWLESASRSNPDSRLFVYDVSAQPSASLRRLADQFPNTLVIPWHQSSWKSPAWIEQTDFNFFWPGFNLRDEIKRLSRRLRHRLTGRKKYDWMIDKQAFVASRQFFIRICSQKPHILRDAWGRSDRCVAYVDADAVVLEHIPGYPGGDSDIAVTVVDPEQVRIGQDGDGPDGPIPIILINAGVVFVNRTPVAPQFLDTWINEMDRVRHGGADQSALNNLLYRNAPEFFKTLRPFHVNTTEGTTAVVTSLPCSRYNQVRISRDSQCIDEDVAIAHFVGSWKQQEHWGRVETLIRNTWRQRNLTAKKQETTS